MPTATKEPRDVLRLKRDPGYFVRAMGLMTGTMEPTAQQDEAFNAVRDGERRITLRSGTGTGKTTLIAALGLHYISTNKQCKVIYTSTKFDQLQHQVWAEMRILQERAHPWIRDGITIAGKTTYRNDNKAGAVALAKVAPVGSPEKQQGWHHENMMIIIDEASGVDDAAIEALLGCCTNPNNILIQVGNPTRRTGLFHASFHKDRELWHCLHFSGVDSPLVSDQFIEELGKRWGVESNYFRVKGLGNFPLSDSDTLIPLDWVEKAAKRSADESNDPVIIGLDPGRSDDGDATGIVARCGNRVLAAKQVWIRDVLKSAGHAKALRDEVMEAWPHLKFGYFAVDVIGLGAGAYDSLNNQGEPCVEVNVAEAPLKRYRAPGEKKPATMRDDLWLITMDYIRNEGSLYGLDGTDELEVLISELSAPKYDLDGQGRIKVESKKLMKKRNVASPNLADALCLTFHPKSTTDAWDDYYRNEMKEHY